MNAKTLNEVSRIVSRHEPVELFKALDLVSSICQNHESLDIHELAGNSDYLRGISIIRELMTAIVEKELIPAIRN